MFRLRAAHVSGLALDHALPLRPGALLWMNLDPSLGIAVFTDGSANSHDRSGGWGWVALDAFGGGETGSGPMTNTTISQMELQAPTDALKRLLGAFGPIDVLVLSDSQYVVLGITDRSRKRRKNLKWWRHLDNAVEGHNYVEFEHIRGHAGHVYNEMADELAKEARVGSP